MKKIVIVSVIILVIMMFKKPVSEVIIPKEAIRFRVIASSNDESDQETKVLVRNSIQAKLNYDLETVKAKEEARSIIMNNLKEYEETVEKTINNLKVDTTFKVNYGENYFPEKVYKGVKYEEGYYESLVVTLGNGLGNNWWCVLFPPLCLLEAEESEEKTEVEYKFFIQELIEKYF